MPRHEVYIEAFWGRGTIARKKRLAAITIGIDPDPVAISDGSARALMFQGCGVEWLKGYFTLTSSDEGYCVEDLAAGLSGADVAASTFGGYSWNRHFVYLDPPYIGCQGRGYYRHELTDEQHADLCRVFLALPCPAALSGYRSDVYDAELHGTRSINYQTVNRAGKVVTEYLWMNYDEPVRYHDTRYVGSGRRERERIRRRVKTWSNGLLHMKPAERQAVWEECQRVYERARASESSGATR